MRTRRAIFVLLAVLISLGLVGSAAFAGSPDAARSTVRSGPPTAAQTRSAASTPRPATSWPRFRCGRARNRATSPTRKASST